MADKLRVHTLSKELGVTSKAILEKCTSESIEGIVNHMSIVSAGLAETIREWFSGEGEHRTAVETAERVDLAKVRVKRPARLRKKKGEEALVEAETPALPEVAVAVVEAAPPTPEPVEEEVVKVEDRPAPPPTVETPAPGLSLIARTEPLIEAPLPGAQPPPERPFPPAVLTPAAEAPRERRPERIVPAGPQNIPAPAQMRGPTVVGFAKPEPVVRPPPRAGPLTAPAPDVPEYVPTSRRGGRGPRGRTAGEAEAVGSRQQVNPRRSTGSLAEVGERLREWNERDLIERQERLQAASGRGVHRRARESKPGEGAALIAPRKTRAQVHEPIVVHELCAATGIGMSQLFPKLKQQHDMIISRNTVIPTELAEVVLLDFGIELQVVKPKTQLDRVAEEFQLRDRPQPSVRPPVVTMLGHVDHGKTSLLDAIRKTSVAAGEAGGITQHIGAYRVERGTLSVTFLDTPGHEAFTAMRARGANMTDVVVLVVAADDGIMPQTIEAINHAKAARVTIVVALNKIDLPGVDVNKIYGQLAEHGLVPTEWGGETDVVKTAATRGEGVEELIEHLATLSELLNLKADPTVPATGTVIESEMRPGVGPLVRVLVREGTLQIGDVMVCGPGAGRVRSLRDDRGRQVKAATPGMPVEVAGLDEVPNAGEAFYCLETLQRAKLVAQETWEQRRQESLVKLQKPRTLEELLRRREGGETPELNLILRADVQGSIDALVKALGDLPSDQVRLNPLHTGIGSVTESDVVLAEASGALIVGFNVTSEAGAQREADARGVDIRLYRVIYTVVDDIRKALEGLLPTEKREEERGKAEVREIFHVSKVGVIAGCLVTDGLITRANAVRVVRDGQIIIPTGDDVKREHHRTIMSLRRFKEDVREVRAGMECGIRVEHFDDVKPGDVLVAYEVVESAGTL